MNDDRNAGSPEMYLNAATVHNSTRSCGMGVTKSEWDTWTEQEQQDTIDDFLANVVEIWVSEGNVVEIWVSEGSDD